ncbi:MAG: peptidoglycan DD-metalloendopeptidase family protein [Gemmatimonadota bacterium]|nr:peptidoglycan DD-metalloendopeptidase family protein [Gemmatimonadota bacterium]
MTRVPSFPVLLSLLVGFASADAAAQRPDITRRIQENQQRLDSIRQERERLQDQLAQLEGRLYTITAELQNIEQQKGATARIVNELDRQINSLDAELDTVTMDLLLAEDAWAEKRAILEKRLVEIYKRGDLWIFEVLLAAESFGDLVSRYKYLYLATVQDRALTKSVEDLRNRVAVRRRELVVGYQELGRQRSERGDELDRFVSLERRRARALRNTRASQQRATDRLDALARDEQQLNDLLASLERERLRVGAGVPGTISGTTLGNLDWPLSGRLLYKFGRQAGPDNTAIRRHGIGISVPVGTDVRAVAAGTIQHAGPLGTYGPTAILDHGGGYYTLYLYLSRLDVAAGTAVSRGQVLGVSGGATSDAGPHIEFQIRERGIPLDPELWLKRR